MTIVSAKFANAENSCVSLVTQEEGAILVELGDTPDVSGGWRDVYDSWAGWTASFVPAVISETVEEFAARNGYNAFALLDLSDIERKLDLLGLEKPAKAAAVREWIDQTRIAFATSQTAQPAPHTYAEVTAEVLALLSQE